MNFKTVIALTLALFVATPSYSQCITPEILKQYAGELEERRLEGLELKGFNATYEKRFQAQAPDVDLVIFYIVDPNVWIISGFKNGCMVVQPQEVPAQVIKELLNGVMVDGQSS